MKGRLPAAERRQQLLDTALHAFSEHGFNQTSMNDIAEAAGVTKPVLYQHFNSKRELFRELLQDLGQRLREAVGKATSEAGTPHEQVERGMRAYFGWVQDHRGGFEILFAGDTRRDPEFVGEVAQVEREIASTIAELIAVDGLDDRHRKLLAYGIVGMSESTCRHWLRHDIELSADELATQVAELAWSGLRGLRPAS